MHDPLREQQHCLARHLRDPQRHAPPRGLEGRRLKLYRTLFYDGIEALLGGSFPVLRQTLGDQRWHARVHDFYANYRCQSPLFTEIPAAFVDYLQGIEPDTPWQPELAHYEMIESQLYLSDARDPEHDPQGDLLQGEPVLSSRACVLSYRWPVDRIGPTFQPLQAPAQPTLLLVYRDAALQVRFARLSPMAYRLLTQVQGCGRQRLQALGADLQAGLALLENLQEQGVVIGTR
ncbi:HvfC family RiPP maturation protein [Pseudomonas fluorescens]|uniref:HvfC family RiPP maturation protein n=1 Tax=Pseudomonas fluorescens TaxID=294 RepID=UPI0020C35589|nr:putative DNA-binding domain-containing protein [Pseudomonas fluorescens]UTL89228.1 putative DNA-binding domain-containing protein [Pseudomonas fluorescens]